MRASGPSLTRASQAAAMWTFIYALYRGYYGLGGTAGMLGNPLSVGQFRRINLVAAGLLLLIGLLPLAALNGWRRDGFRPVLLTTAWIIAVGSISHALIGLSQRLLSLSGLLTIPYPFWQTIDRRRADLQALFFNEPWFLILGLLWIVIAWTGGLAESSHRRWWIRSAGAAIAIATTVGILSAVGVIGRVVVG